MTQDKRSIGFSTPNKEFEDTFIALQNELSKQKSDWLILKEMYEKILKIFENKRDKFSEVESLLRFIIIASLQITKIGIELNEVHSKLAKVEKATRTLKSK